MNRAARRARPFGPAVVTWCVFGSSLAAQGPPGGRAGGPPPTGKAGARVDFTGYWVSVVSEDWRWRMITPAKGDYANIPLNAAGRKIADALGSREGSGRRRGVPRVCRARDHARARPSADHLAGRQHVEDRHRCRDADATAALHAPNSPPPADGEPTWQGTSIARWEAPPRGLAGNTIPLGLGARAGTDSRTLEVITTRIRPGYLRKNGVPFSAGTTMTEYFDLFKDPDGLDWFVVTSIVRDPQFLNGPWVTTSHFKKEPDGAKWKPSPCAVR